MKRRKSREYEWTEKNEVLRPYAYHLATCLICLRKSKWIYQDQLAEKIGISQTLISNYESGWANPNLYHLIRIADFFNVKVSDLVDPTVELDKILGPNKSY